MDPGWDHTENEDKLLLTHTLGMGRDMGTNVDSVVYGSEIRGVSGSGCKSDRISGGDGSVSLSGEYNRHISTISGNILNANQNSLSLLAIDYIAYFYTVFPLHPNTFHRLFQHSTQPQLYKLKDLITSFYGLNTNICFYSQILSLSNEYYISILNLSFLTFDFISSSIQANLNIYLYLLEIKQHLYSIINLIHKRVLQSVRYISYIIRIVVFYFNVLLQIYYEKFKKNIEGHKESLEKNIKEYIQKIKSDLEYVGFNMTYKLISDIENNLKSLSANQTKLDQFNQYTVKEKLMKPCTSINGTEHFNEIFEAHTKYKECLCCYSKIKCELNKFMRELRYYNSYNVLVASGLDTFKCSLKYPSIIQKTTIGLKSVKRIYVDKFGGYIKCVKKLEEIGEHIRTMKSTLAKVEGKVKDEAKDYIQELKGISINASDVESDIRKINSVNNIIIGKLQIARHTIQFYKSLESEINNLNDVEFHDYNFTEFLKNSKQIKEKLTIFDKAIKEAISKIKKSFREIPGHTVFIDSDTYKESKYTSDIQKIINIIDIILLEISVIRFIVYYLLIIKSNSASSVKEIKTKINEIKDVETGITNLKEILRSLRLSYYIHRNSMNMVVIFNFISFARFYIDKYINSLSLVKYYVEILIFVIKCYIWILSVIRYVTSELKRVKEKIEKLISELDQTKKLENYTSNIINSLKSTESSLESLKRVNDDLDNIKKLKNNISKIKYHIKQVYQNLLEIKVNLNEIHNIILKLYIINIGIINVQKSINDIMISIYNLINYLNTYYLSIILLIQKRPEISEEKKLVFLIHSISVFKLIENLQSIIKYLSGINKLIVKIGIKEFIQNIESQTNNTEILVKKIESNIDKVDKSITGVESAIEGVVLNFIKCTIKSLTTNLISINRANHNRIIKDIGVAEVDNQVVGVYSVLSANQYKDLVNGMLEFWTFCDESVELFKYIRYCLCAFHFESRYRAERPSTFPYSLPFIKTRDTNPVSELVRSTTSENVGNHMCLCLVIKYHLRPTLLKCILYLRNEELGTLDTISRKFENYNSLLGVKAYLWKLCALILNIIYELTSLLRNRYPYARKRYMRVDMKCLCCYYQDQKYSRVVSIVLVLSSLIENIWSMDTESLRLSIECLSSLLAEYQSTHIYTNYYSPLRYKIYTLVVDNDCKKRCQCKDGEKCCWWCVTCFNLVVMCVSLCLQCKLCKVICNKKENGCKKVDDYFNLEKLECKCTCQDKQKGFCCLLNIALSEVVGSEDLQKKLEECCTECLKEQGCCKKILEKVKAGKCKLLLLGCCCNDANCGCPEGISQDVKVKCLIFKDLNERTSVAVVVFCKCSETPKGCCCLNTLVEKLESKLKNLCSEDCCCDKLKDCCEQLCCSSNCADCVCKQLQESCKEITKTCNNGNGLCKLLTENISNCCKKGTCPCGKSDEKGCCRCGWCKIVAHCIKILTRACRANVLEPYKRITIELLSCSKDKPELIRKIIKSINGTTLNNIYLVKNNLISSNSYPYSIGSYTATIDGVTNVETRNWGYDTNYEHDVTTDKGFRRGDGHPYVSHRNRTGDSNSMSSNKAFKIIISRLLVGGVIVFVFLYLRVRYHIIYQIII